MRHRGYTTTEILVVVVIVGILATVAMPPLSATDAAKVELAATHIAEALRFARRESMRTNQLHSVSADGLPEQLRAAKADLNTTPVSEEFLLRHPVTMQLYAFDFLTDTATAGVQIVNAVGAFNYVTVGNKTEVLFNGSGVPIWIETVSGNVYSLTTGQITVALGGHQRIVDVAPYTGRITIQ